MPKITRRRNEVDRTGQYMEVLKGPGFKTVIKREAEFAVPLNSEGEYKALVDAGVPVAKVYRTFHRPHPEIKRTATHIAQQVARDIKPHEFVGFAPQIARIIHTAAESYLAIPDLKHSNIGVVERQEKENRGQAVVVRDITSFVWPMDPKMMTREKIVDQAVAILHKTVREDYGRELADELEKNVREELAKRAKTTK
jgi:hypothetical protein